MAYQGKSASHKFIGLILKLTALGVLALSIFLFVTGIKQITEAVGIILVTASIILFILGMVWLVVVLFFLGATELKEGDEGTPKHTESQKIIAAHYARSETRICPACKAVAKVDDCFCPKCGAKLED